MDLLKSCESSGAGEKATGQLTCIFEEASSSAPAATENDEIEEEEEEVLVNIGALNSSTASVWNNNNKLIPADNFHKYCYRHNPDVTCNKQKDVNKMTEIQQNLERLPFKDQESTNQIWSSFASANSLQRNVILQGILSQCCFQQLSFVSQEVSSLIRIDFISTLPIELSLKILCYLDCESLCNAAQVSRNWKKLADDDRVWHHMCEQHIDRKCPNCGWGLPLMHMKRAREIAEIPVDNSQVGAAVFNGQKRRRLSNQTIGSNGVRKTRPWKTVYSERFKVERNWRKGIYKLKEFVGHTDGILTLKYDHKYLFTGSYDTTVKIWDIASGKLLRNLESHTKGVKSLIFDEQKLITGSLDSTIKVWNYHTGQCISTYRGHQDAVLSVDFYKKFIVSGSADTTLKVWNVETRTCHALRGHTEAVNSVKIHPQSNTVFSASDDTTIKMWDLTTHRCIKVFKGHIAQVQKVIPLNLPKDYELVKDYEEEGEEKTQDEASNDGNDTNNDNDNAQEDGEVLDEIDWSDESRKYPAYILTASLDNTVKLWDVKTGKCVRTQFGHVEGIWDISADTFRIVSGAHDRFVKIWDMQSGKCMHTFPGHSSPVTCVGLGDSSFASGDDNGVVRMLNFDNFE
jgi:F-box/WD-40 domain protein MET30